MANAVASKARTVPISFMALACPSLLLARLPSVHNGMSNCNVSGIDDSVTTGVGGALKTKKGRVLKTAEKGVTVRKGGRKKFFFYFDSPKYK